MAYLSFIDYHIQSSKIRDIDPANDALLYVSNRFELTMEQRYWLAFLYSCTYCAPTVYYIYNEFPDYENVDIPRMERWWKSNKDKCIFQTDRLRIKSSNKLVETFQSYQQWIGGDSQVEIFEKFRGETIEDTYLNLYDELGKIKNIGRFTLFLYLEMISVLTDLKMTPDRIDWKYADNCREGLEYHMQDTYGDAEHAFDYIGLDHEMIKLCQQFDRLGCEHSNIFNIETTLCAYKKYRHGKRYVGYYIDRQKEEIEKMERNVPTGVAWRALWEFRQETYKHIQHESSILNNWELWGR
jgi:hypothetical protein